jgi:hypothetical protein
VFLLSEAQPKNALVNPPKFINKCKDLRVLVHMKEQRVHSRFFVFYYFTFFKLPSTIVQMSALIFPVFVRNSPEYNNPVSGLAMAAASFAGPVRCRTLSNASRCPFDQSRFRPKSFTDKHFILGYWSKFHQKLT